jgi:putative peptide zinc metalloprotease protein
MSVQTDSKAVAAGRHTIALAERVEILTLVPAFVGLSKPTLEAIARAMVEEEFAAGSGIISQGESADKFYLIARGRTEVTSQTPEGPIVLSTQDRGEIFGELSLLKLTRTTRRVSVTAIDEVLALTLDSEAVQALVTDRPDIRQVFETPGEVVQVARFLKRAAPFATLSPQRVLSLAARLKTKEVPSGAVIIKQGEPGDACYLIRAGKVEVIAEDADSERRLATLGAGMMLGEAALMSGEPRNATVRSLEQSELLVLHRNELLEAIDEDTNVGSHLVELIHLRDRPRQAPGIIAVQRATPDGEVITTLKDARRGVYFRLSPQGWFIWQQLDGDRTLRDLSLAYMSEFGSFSPQAISDLLEDLAAAGFLHARNLRADVARAAFKVSPLQRAVITARRIMEWRVKVDNADPAFTRLYNSGVNLLFTKIGLLLVALLTGAGIVGFIFSVSKVADAISSGPGLAVLFVALIPCYIVSTLFHEAGHGLTAKSFGHEVPRVGIGWYWFSPIAFVDTSDMWLAARWPRIAVSLGGLGGSVVLGSVAAVLGWIIPNDVVTTILWELALVAYVEVVLNLNPLLEYDGYFMLMDWLDYPNLRAHCLEWLGREFPRVVRGKGSVKGHRLEMFYGLGAVLYILAVILFTLLSYRLLIQGWLTQVTTNDVAVPLAWALALVTVVLGLFSLLGELAGIRHRPVPS